MEGGKEGKRSLQNQVSLEALGTTTILQKT